MKIHYALFGALLAVAGSAACRNGNGMLDENPEARGPIIQFSAWEQSETADTRTLTSAATDAAADHPRFLVETRPWNAGAADTADVADAPTDGAPTKGVTETANLSGFYLMTTEGSGAETTVSRNVRYERRSTGYFETEEDRYWPDADRNYHFYAASASFGATGFLVDCSASDDVVCAALEAPSFQQTNTLWFRHVFARVGRISVKAPAGYTATLTQATLTCPDAGSYDVPAAAWHATAATKAHQLNAENDIRVVPGTWSLSVTFNLSDGSDTKSGITRSGQVGLTQGCVNDITVSVSDAYTYELTVSPSSSTVYIDGAQTFTATCSTLYQGSVISRRDVTASAVWSADDSDIASVSAGRATGIGPGTTRIRASYGGLNASAAQKVLDFVQSYGTPVVKLFYGTDRLTAAGGDTSLPLVSYTQAVVWRSGKTEQLSSGAALSFSGSATGFSLDAAGRVSVQPNFAIDARELTVTASVSLNGKTGSGQAVIRQGGDRLYTLSKPSEQISVSAGETVIPLAGVALCESGTHVIAPASIVATTRSKGGQALTIGSSSVTVPSMGATLVYAGEYVVTVTYSLLGVSQTATVQITQAENELQAPVIQAESTTLKVGETTSAKVIVGYTSGTKVCLTEKDSRTSFDYSSKGYFSIDNQLIITALKVGTAKLCACYYDNLSGGSRVGAWTTITVVN